MPSRHFVVTLLSILFAIGSQFAFAEVDQARLNKLDHAMQAYIDDGRVAGSVVLIRHQGKDVYFRAFGHRDLEAGSKMEKDTIFRIASMSKAIVSVAVMQLQEDGKLNIRDAVGKYLPEFQETTVAVAREDDGYDLVAARRPIAIRDLLTHTAGIGYGNGPAAEKWKAANIQGWYFADRKEPIRETIRRIASLPFDAQPRDRFVYGYNTDILGAIVEVVSEETLDQYLSHHVLEPLAMTDTHFYLPVNKRQRFAVTYAAQEDGSIVRSPDTSDMFGQGEYVDGPRQSFSGGAGLLSTASDYSRFLQMMLNSGSLDEVRILSRHSVKLMTVDHIQGIDFEPGVGFGLGFSIAKDLGARGSMGSVGEYAWGGAYHTTYWVDPAEQLVVVYMTQLLPARGLDDSRKLRALIYQALQ
jgi:CubicO group peptidase (beta-lactamase class C family)